MKTLLQQKFLDALYLRDLYEPELVKTWAIFSDAARTLSNDPLYDGNTCETGSASFSGDDIFASQWNLKIKTTSTCSEANLNAYFDGRITVAPYLQSGPTEGNVTATFGDTADARPYYIVSSDGLADDESKGYLGDLTVTYANDGTDAYSISFASMRLSNYLADTVPEYNPQTFSDITRTIRDFNLQSADGDTYSSVNYTRTWTEEGRDFTIRVEVDDLDLDNYTGSYTFALDAADSDLHDVTFTVEYMGDRAMLTHILNGVVQSEIIDFLV